MENFSNFTIFTQVINIVHFQTFNFKDKMEKINKLYLDFKRLTSILKQIFFIMGTNNMGRWSNILHSTSTNIILASSNISYQDYQNTCPKILFLTE